MRSGHENILQQSLLESRQHQEATVIGNVNNPHEAFALIFFTLEYRKTPANARPVPETKHPSRNDILKKMIH